MAYIDCKKCIHYKVCVDFTSQAAMDEVCKVINGEDCLPCDNYLSKTDVVEVATGVISEIPNVKLSEVRYGRWIKASCSEKDGDAHCSECHHWDWSDCNFCSNCGANMRGKQ